MSSNKGQVVGYIRVSSVDQNPERQQEQLSAYNLDAVFTDYASGKDVDRPELNAALKHLRNGDTLITCSMDRLARNVSDLRQIVDSLTVRGVVVQFIKEAQTFKGDDSPTSKLLLNLMGAFAEFERSLIRERQLEGIAIAKAKGAYRGRKPALTPEAVSELIAKDKANNHKNRSALAKEYGFSRETLYQYLKTANA